MLALRAALLIFLGGSFFAGKSVFPPDLPPVLNWPLYIYRVLVKWFSFFFFGLATLTLVIIAFPPMRLVLHPRERFKKYGRRFVSSFMRRFVSLMHFLGIVNLEVDNRENFRHLSSKILAANHPSLLDIVMLFSLIPNVDCIVNTSLNRNFIVKGVVRQLYILNSLDIENIFQACTESLKQGNCLVIFPEGTRTPRSGKAAVKRGAARIALYSGCNIVPAHIGGTDKFGLGKKDPWIGFNTRERYVYRVSMGPEINPEKCRNLSAPKAVRALTREIAAFLFPAQNEKHDEA
ncbi:MAG: 1-acyl-sn-glycerol-3-phosphate acyltransferase [Spirochaetaceae bacterium]|jgi:1-acyl-sn-glycerol-3-phosphate acyltransferase|nr:1-acyl-sn-glycerol-3-phosphate acyltransferase [Spirochaetaceae bacterium]